MKYPEQYELDPSDEKVIIQEITLVNNHSEAWPLDTRLKLIDADTDIEVA